VARDFRAGNFLNTDVATAEDADPRIGLVNLADVMLVFACGLMLALVSYWNLDISAMQEVVKADEITEVSDVEQMQDQLSAGGTGYTELGMVYQDPMTGKLYMLTQDLGENAAGDGAGSTTGSATEGATEGAATAPNSGTGDGTAANPDPTQGNR
jgi:hypothetical protein